MSRYVKVNTDILDDVNTSVLEEAIKAMGLGIDKSVKSISSQTLEVVDGEVDYAIITRNGDKRIGIQLERNMFGGNKATLKGDFWRTGYSEKMFMDELQQNYQEINIARIQENTYGGSLVSRTVLENGDVELVYAVA